MKHDDLKENNLAKLTIKEPDQVICQGPWTKQGVILLQKKISTFPLPKAPSIKIHGRDISQMDSAGAWLLHDVIQQIKDNNSQFELLDFNQDHLKLLKLLEEQEVLEQVEEPPHIGSLALTGMKTEKGLKELLKFLDFTGELFVHGLLWIRYPSRIRWVSLLSGIQFTGFNAILIVGLLAFLIGIVLAYQVGVQLSEYGADIYVVDLLGIAILREFGPLLTAIILAGRTGSSYTAQIGSMKLNEEVDALSTFGLSPIELLVLPRLFALIIALPLLTVLADVLSVFGGMVMAKGMLSIGYADFLSRFGKVIELKNYMIGIGKTPVFAMLIAAIGCFQGFQVSGSAESVGRHTTTSVVQAIFMIIVADAAFSIIFTKLGI